MRFTYVRGDVNGDGIPDNVYLTGIKTSDSPFILDIIRLVFSNINVYNSIYLYNYIYLYLFMLLYI